MNPSSTLMAYNLYRMLDTVLKNCKSLDPLLKDLNSVCLNQDLELSV